MTTAGGADPVPDWNFGVFQRTGVNVCVSVRAMGFGLLLFTERVSIRAARSPSGCYEPSFLVIALSVVISCFEPDLLALARRLPEDVRVTRASPSRTSRFFVPMLIGVYFRRLHQVVVRW